MDGWMHERGIESWTRDNSAFKQSENHLGKYERGKLVFRIGEQKEEWGGSFFRKFYANGWIIKWDKSAKFPRIFSTNE